MGYWREGERLITCDEPQKLALGGGMNCFASLLGTAAVLLAISVVSCDSQRDSATHYKSINAPSPVAEQGKPRIAENPDPVDAALAKYPDPPERPDPAKTPDPREAALVAFQGFCLEGLPDFSESRRLAAAGKFPKAPEEFNEGVADQHSWIINALPNLVIGAIRGSDACSAIIPNIDADELLALFSKKFRVKKVVDESEGFQRVRGYSIEYREFKSFVMATNSEDSGRPVMSLGVLHPDLARQALSE